MAVPFSSTVEPDSSASLPNEDDVRRGVELLYFGYTRLTRSVDDKLTDYGLGRAHNRALYFIARQPDLSVSDLLRILAITKQSLGRVLNDLSAHGLIESRPGSTDRRQKLLSLTEKGVKFEATLFDILYKGMTSAYTSAGGDAVKGFWQVLERLIPEAERPMVEILQGRSL